MQIHYIKYISQTEKMADENAGVHFGFTLWFSEIALANFDIKEKIKGIKNIPKKI